VKLPLVEAPLPAILVQETEGVATALHAAEPRHDFFLLNHARKARLQAG